MQVPVSALCAHDTVCNIREHDSLTGPPQAQRNRVGMQPWQVNEAYSTCLTLTLFSLAAGGVSQLHLGTDRTSSKFHQPTDGIEPAYNWHFTLALLYISCDPVSSYVRFIGKAVELIMHT